MMHKQKKIFIGVLLIFFICLRVSKGFQKEKDRSSQIDAVHISIKKSADYLFKNIKNNGMFMYRINMDSTVKVKEKYNILRHSGTIYAMSMYYQMNPNDEMRSLLERIGKYLKDESIGYTTDGDNLLSVWSKPEVNKSNQPLQAKLGGTGLGLVALLSLEKIHPEFTPLADLRKLGQFITYMQKENGDFYFKYVPSMGGRQDGWLSEYYPGEAALGLVMLYEKDHSDIWIQSAVKALEYLAEKRKNTTDIPADHWALLATQKLFSLENIEKLAIPRDLLINHGIQICEIIIKEQIEGHKQSKYNGGFAKDGRTTPASTRLEGLLAALSFLPKDQDIVKRIDTAVYRGISFLLQAQINEGEFAGAFPRAISKIDQNTRKTKKIQSTRK